MHIPIALLLLTTAACAAAAMAPPPERTDPPAAAASREFPDDWFWDVEGSLAKRRPMLGTIPPPLSLSGWVGTPVSLDSLRREGKVVVVDFWATWCGPCVQSLPKMAALSAAHPDDLVILGVHDSKRGSDRMVEVAGRAGVRYPLAIDDGGRSERAWNISFWPTIAVIDRTGSLRAIGLKPEHVAEAVERVLAEPRGRSGPVRDDLASLREEADAKRLATLEALEAAPAAPPLEAAEWTNTKPLALADLKGKVVVLDFWATWCGPCLASIPHANELARKFAGRVVFLGVCHPRGGERMAETVKTHGIAYPTCRLLDEKVLATYAVNGFPDYVLIGTDGRVRLADCRNDAVETAIERLLAE